MPQVRRLIGKAGAEFENEMHQLAALLPVAGDDALPGQYAHDHGVLGNGAPLGGFDRFDTAHDLPVWLQRAGYYSAHVGKLMNGYEASPVGVPPGWSEWHGSKRTYWYYGYQLLEAAGLRTYGSIHEDTDAPANPGSYNSDVYTDKAVDIPRSGHRASSRSISPASYLALHGVARPSDPAVRPAATRRRSRRPTIWAHSASTPTAAAELRRGGDVSDKPAAIADRSPLSAKDRAT